MAVAYLNKAVIPQRMDFPVKTETKQSSEKATEKHPECQVVPEGHPLSKNATVKTIQNTSVISQAQSVIYPILTMRPRRT